MFKSSLGVLPLRKSSEFAELNLVLKGRPVQPSEITRGKLMTQHQEYQGYVEEEEESNEDDEDEDFEDYGFEKKADDVHRTVQLPDDRRKRNRPRKSQFIAVNRRMLGAEALVPSNVGGQEDADNANNSGYESGMMSEEDENNKIHANLNTPVTLGNYESLYQGPYNEYNQTGGYEISLANEMEKQAMAAASLRKLKPAILAATGTLSAATLSERPRPQGKLRNFCLRSYPV